jgi:hypothetical protein
LRAFALRRGAFCVPADWPNQILQRVSIPDGRAGYRPSQHCNYGSKKPDRSHDAVIRIYDEAGNVIETHEHAGRFQRAEALLVTARHGTRSGSLVSISSVALGHCVRHGPDTGGPSDRNCNLESLHSHVVSLYYMQRSGIWAQVIRFRHVTKELFSSVTPFCLANPHPARSQDFTRIGFCFAKLA